VTQPVTIQLFICIISLAADMARLSVAEEEKSYEKLAERRSSD